MECITHVNLYELKTCSVNPQSTPEELPEYPPTFTLHPQVHPSQIYLTDRTTKGLIWLHSKSYTNKSELCAVYMLSLPLLPAKFHLVALVEESSVADIGWRSMSRVHRPQLFFGWFEVNGKMRALPHLF